MEQLEISDDVDMHELAELIREQGVEAVIDDSLGFEESETLYETEGKISPEENAEASTVEVYENDTLKWENRR